MKSPVFTLSFALFLSACGPSAIEYIDAAAGQRGAGLYVLKSEVWGEGATLDVCWESDFDHEKFSYEKSLVYWVIKSTWERYGNFKTRGWGTCRGRQGNADIRIGVEDNASMAPHTKGLGEQLKGRHKGMVLNFSFKKWGTEWPNYAGSRVEAIQWIAMHEFGHALGFAHEHNRQEGRELCDALPQGANGTATVGYYEPNSLMNYCGDQKHLSPGDVTGLLRYYGQKSDIVLWERFYDELKHVWTARHENTPLSPWFDPPYCSEHHEDLAHIRITNVHALVHHYVTWGIGEGRQASVFFDPKYYLRENPDVAAQFGAKNYSGAAMHYQSWGLDEGRAGSAQFDPKIYLKRYPDVAQIYGEKNYFQAVVHFSNKGQREGRSGSL